MINIIKNHIPIDHYHRDGVKLRNFRGVSIHETGNTAKGANVNAHILYIHNLVKNKNTQYIGYHLFVDDIEAGEVTPLDERVWINGDGSNGTGNNETVSIEICVNSDGDFNKARNNAAWLAAFVLHQHNITKVIDGLQDKANGNLFQHYSWSGKNCPQTIREKGMWNAFVASTQKHLDGMNSNISETNNMQYYKINTSFNDGKWNASQKGAFVYSEVGLKEAIDFYVKQGLDSSYYIFDPNGAAVYPMQNNSSAEVDKLKLQITELQNTNQNLKEEIKEFESALISVQSEKNKYKDIVSQIRKLTE